MITKNLGYQVPSWLHPLSSVRPNHCALVFWIDNRVIKVSKLDLIITSSKGVKRFKGNDAQKPMRTILLGR